MSEIIEEYGGVVVIAIVGLSIVVAMLKILKTVSLL